LKDFAGGRFNLTAIGYFLPFGLESRDRALQDFSDRPMAVDVFQSLLDGEGGDVNGLRNRSGSSPASMQPANLLDFATAVSAFGRLLWLLRSPEESASFQRFRTGIFEFAHWFSSRASGVVCRPLVVLYSRDHAACL
jgi:hypothetical protein